MHAFAAVEGLSALLGACGAAGALEKLNVRHDLPTLARCWLPGMRHLRQLTLIAEDTGIDQWEVAPQQLCYDPPPWAFSGLEHLSLAASQVEIVPTAHLPTSLTRLHVCGLTGIALPLQVRWESTELVPPGQQPLLRNSLCLPCTMQFSPAPQSHPSAGCHAF